ncbi:MAG TPA: nuclear transport factor 2 family protein [Longimicrobiales bacterium]|nr:nuclear transport factor 2 family protein [Longimicrobiales bacterium]
MRCIPLVAVVPVLMAGCQSAEAPSAAPFDDAMKAEIAAEVDAAATDWWNAWADVDYDRGMTFFEDAPEAAWTGDKGTLYTVAGMNAQWGGTWGADWQRQQIDFTDSRTIVLAPDIAYTIRQYDATVTDTAGTVLPMTKGVETIVWVKRNGAWKVLLGHESTLDESWMTRLEIEGN